jgi:hypothetical protein
MPGCSSVFTIGYVADLLGEDEDWLHELSIDMFPEDGASASAAKFKTFRTRCAGVAERVLCQMTPARA